LVSFPNLSTSSYANQYIIGKSINIHRVYHLLGVNDSTGLYEFSTSKGSPTYSPSYPQDLTATINTDPKFYGNFQNTWHYRNFILTANFYFINKLNSNYYYGAAIPGGQLLNQPVWELNRWQKPGDHKPIQIYNSNYNDYPYWGNAASSDASYSSASFIRLRNLAFAYQLPASVIKTLKMQSGSINIQCQNLLTISNFKGLDPETGNNRLPPLRIITIGANISF
jgi:hypothetical protein